MWKPRAPLRARVGATGGVGTCRHRWHVDHTSVHMYKRTRVHSTGPRGGDHQVPLSGEQQAVVKLQGGEAVVAAGPGTGKTHVVAARIVELLMSSPCDKQDAVSPCGVLALTFTHAAALTLRQRVERTIPIDRSAVGAAKHSYEICTMHAFAKQAVAQYHLLLGLPHEPTVLSRAEQSLFISRILHRLPLRLYAAATGLQRHAEPGGSDTRSSHATPVLIPAAGNMETRRFVSDLIAFFGHLQERGLTAASYRSFLHQWIRDISTATETLPPSEMSSSLDEANCELYERALELCSCYGEYERIKREQSMIDMGDMILQLHELLKHHPSAALQLAGRYDHMVVDEFQDLSPVQVAVVERLWAARKAMTDFDQSDQAAPQDNKDPVRADTAIKADNMGFPMDSAKVVPSMLRPSLLVVGDDAQSIFQWRLGKHDETHLSDGEQDSLQPLEHFLARHKRAKVFRLQQSYRSFPPLQRAANRVLGCIYHSDDNEAPIDFAGVDQKEQGEEDGCIERHRFETAADEAAWIAQRVRTLVKSGQAQGFGDIAVLCRHNFEARRLGKALATAGIATNVVGGSRLFEVPRVADLLHLLAALVQWPGHGCYHLYSFIAAASSARQQSPAANSPEGCFADLFGLPLPLLTALSSYNSQSEWPLRRLIEEAAQGPNCGELCDKLTAVCGASLSADAARSVLLDLHNTLSIYEARVHTMPPSLLLSRLLEESGMAAAYSMAADHSEAIHALGVGEKLIGNQDPDTVTAVQQMREAAAVGRFLRYLAALEQERSLTGGGATDCGFGELTHVATPPSDRAAATFLVPYLHSLREAGEDPAIDIDDDGSVAHGDSGGRSRDEIDRLGISSSVDVLTIHKAKGLEWSHVFIACATESHLGSSALALPVGGSGRRRRQTLSSDLPLPAAAGFMPEVPIDEGSPVHNFCQGGTVDDGSRRKAVVIAAHTEARKLFYVAMTRARESLTFTSARHYGGARGRNATAGAPEQECTFVTEAVGKRFDPALSEPVGLGQPINESISSRRNRSMGDGKEAVSTVIVRADPEVAQDLLDASARLMETLFPPEDNYCLTLDELRSPDVRFFVAQNSVQTEPNTDASNDNGGAAVQRRFEVVGCGALAVRDGYGEVKSMFVHENARGKGVASSLLGRLEDEARTEGLPVVRLETGNALHNALRLYSNAGFVTLPGPFGEYVANASSVFMEKVIRPA